MVFTKKENEKIFTSPIFAGVDITRTSTLLEKHGCRAVDFEEGDIILSKSQASHKAGIFLSGEAVATTADNSKNALLRFFKAGDFFGIANLFTNENYVSSIRAKRNAVCSSLLKKPYANYSKPIKRFYIIILPFYRAEFAISTAKSVT